MTKYNELTSRAARNPQPLLTTIDAITSAAALVSDLPTPVFTPSTLANLEEVFSYSQIPTSVSATSESSCTSLPFNISSSVRNMKAQMAAADSSDYSDDENSRGSDYQPPTVKRAKAVGSYATSSRSASPDLLDSQPLRRRRPMRADDAHLCPEDFARVVQRRQRNKEAAARCRQRRVDLMEQLQAECSAIESANADLESNIDKLRQRKEQLEFCLEAHRSVCSMATGLKAPARPAQAPARVVMNKQPAVITATSNVAVDTNNNNSAFIARPTSLLLSRTTTTAPATLPQVTPGTIAAVTGIPITTPSSLLPAGLGFDLLLDGQSGLTPLVPVLPTPQLEVMTPSSLDNVLTSV